MEMMPTAPNYGPAGEANIAVLGQQLQIVFKGSNTVVNVPVTLLPPSVVAKKLPANKSYRVSINGKYDKLTMFNPWAGTFVAKFIGFKRGNNQPIPTPQYPRERTGKNEDGTTYPKDWLEFNAVVELIEAPYAGLQLSVKLRYYFTLGSDGKRAAVSGTGKHSVKLNRFLEVIMGDASDVNVPFSDNVLPALEALLLEKGHPFTVVIANGWADAFGEAAASYWKKSGSKPAAKKATAKKAAPKKKK